MPIDTLNLSSLSNLFYLFFSRWAGIALYSISILVYSILRRESFYALLSIVLGFILRGIIATNLGYIILSANITIIIAVEALLDPIGAIIELALIDITVLCYSYIDNGINYFWVYEFNNNRGYLFKNRFPS